MLAAKQLGLFRLSRWLTRDRLRILCYHGIWLDDRLPNPFNFLYMRPERFAARMALLKDNGFQVLPLDEGLRRLHDGNLPDAAVAITIDDGWYGTYSRMVPELLSRGFPATVYLTTYHAEKQSTVFEVALQHILLTSPSRILHRSREILNFLEHPTYSLDDVEQRSAAQRLISEHAELQLSNDSREELLESLAHRLGYNWLTVRANRQFSLMTLSEAKECADQGIDFQLHTHRHRVTHAGKICIAAELEDNRKRLERVSSKRASHFCYPSGRWHHEHFGHLEAADVESATTTENGLCDRRRPLLALPRILDGDRVDDLAFEAELCGLIEIKRMLMAPFHGRTSRDV